MTYRRRTVYKKITEDVEDERERNDIVETWSRDIPLSSNSIKNV